MARPPNPNPRSVRLPVYMTPDERARLDAVRGSRSPSDHLMVQSGVRFPPHTSLRRWPEGARYIEVDTGDVYSVARAGIDHCGQVHFRDTDGQIVCITPKVGRFRRLPGDAARARAVDIDTITTTESPAGTVTTRRSGRRVEVSLKPASGMSAPPNVEVRRLPIEDLGPRLGVDAPKKKARKGEESDR